MVIELYHEHEAVRQAVHAGRTLGGGYDPESGHLLLDGGEDEDSNISSSIISHYAHEFSHAMDGPDHELSVSVSWRTAWHKEILASLRPLSVYAQESAREGFAEFGRIMYSGVVTREVLAVVFPLCVAYWKGRGLW